MKHGTVLNVHTVADTDRVYISAENCIEPNTAILSHYYIADDGCIVGQITIFTDLRSKPSY